MRPSYIAKMLLPLLLLVSINAAAFDLKPVPENDLDGNALSIPELNIHVEAPGSQWDWFIASETQGDGKNSFHLFACYYSDLRQFAITVSEPYSYPPTMESTYRLMDGVISEFEHDGYVVTASEPEPSDIPLPGSYRYQITGENHLGARSYFYGYYASQGRDFTFLHHSAEDSEPAEFTNFVSSFKFVGTTPKGPLDSAPAAHRVLAFAIVLIVGLVGWIINKVSGRVVFNQWNVALVLLFLAGFVLTIVWFPKIPGPEAMGRFLASSIFFPFFLPILFSFWRSKALRKRKARELDGSGPAEDRTDCD